MVLTIFSISLFTIIISEVFKTRAMDALDEDDALLADSSGLKSNKNYTRYKVFNVAGFVGLVFGSIYLVVLCPL